MVKVRIRHYDKTEATKELADKWFGGEIFEASVSNNVVVLGEHLFNMVKEVRDIEGFELAKDHYYFCTDEITNITYEFNSINELNQTEICEYLYKAIFKTLRPKVSRSKGNTEYEAKLAEEKAKLRAMRKKSHNATV